MEEIEHVTLNENDQAIEQSVDQDVEQDVLRPCRDLDAAIHTRFIEPVLVLQQGHFGKGGYAIPAYTGNIQDAVDLCKKLLPGWVWRLCTCYVSDDAWLMPDMNAPEYTELFNALWGDMADPLTEGPGLDISTTPPDRPALALMTCLLAVVDGLEEGRVPYDDGREIQELYALRENLAEIDRLDFQHPQAV